MEMRSRLMGAAVPTKNGSQIRITANSVLLAAGSIGLTCILVDASLMSFNRCCLTNLTRSSFFLSFCGPSIVCKVPTSVRDVYSCSHIDALYFRVTRRSHLESFSRYRAAGSTEPILLREEYFNTIVATERSPC
jgi:hypothetical protein